MDRLLGWTMKQWALALATINEKPKNISEAAKIKRYYLSKHRMDPIEELTVYSPDGDTRPCDWETATLLIKIV